MSDMPLADAPAPGRTSTFSVPPHLRHDSAQRQRFAQPQEMPCPLCGAPALFGAKERLAACPSCAAPLVRGPDDHTPIAPTGVLPFRVAEAEVPALAAAGIKTLWLPRPDGATLGPFERIYVPMWRFTTHVVCSWVRESSHRDSSGTTVTTRSTGEFADDYEFQAAASTEINGDLLQLLEDVPLHGADPFAAGRVAGARLLPITVPVQDAWGRASRYFHDRAMAGTSGGVYSAWPHWSREQGALVFVPAYLAYEQTRHVSVPVIVDGVTGKVFGGIANKPFQPEFGPPSTFAKVFTCLVLGVLAWAILRWLDVSFLDILGLLDAILGSDTPPITERDIIGN